MNWKLLWRKKASLTHLEAANKRRAYLFILCFVVSAMFWLFNKLSQETSAPFHQYLVFADYPDGLVAASQSDSLVHYRLKSTGIRLIGLYFFSRPDTLSFQARNLPTVVRNNRRYNYITGGQISTLLADAHGAWVSVQNTSPDTVFLELVPATRKKLPVKLNADVAFDQRFKQSGDTSIEPDSIWISGPVTLLDTLSYIETEHWQAGKLRQTARQELKLLKPVDLPSVSMETGSIEVRIPVEEFTESFIELRLEVECPEEYDISGIRLFPNTITVTYLVSLNNFAAVEEGMFRAVVRCPQVTDDSNDRLAVELINHPAFVEILGMHPRVVEYLILE